MKKSVLRAGMIVAIALSCSIGVTAQNASTNPVGIKKTEGKVLSGASSLSAKDKEASLDKKIKDIKGKLANAKSSEAKAKYEKFLIQAKEEKTLLPKQ